MARDLNLSVTLSAINKATGPLKQIMQGSRGAGSAIRDTRDQLRNLQDQQKQLTAFRDMSRQSHASRRALMDKREELRQLSRQLESTEGPTKRLTQQQANAQREVDKLSGEYRQQRDQVRELARQLPAGTQGTRGFKEQNAALEEQIRRTNERLGRQQDALRRLGNADVSGNFRNMTGEVRRFGRNVTIAGGLAAGSIFGLANSTADLGDDVGKTAAKLGLTNAELQELRYAGERSGVATKTLDSSMIAFTKRLGEAAEGTGAAAKGYEALGLDAQRLADMPVAEAMREVADRMAEIENPTRRNAIAAQLYSRAGVGLVNMLKDGSQGLDDYGQAARDTGYMLSDEATTGSENFKDALLDTQLSMKGMKNTIGAELMPAVVDIMRELTGWMRANREEVKTFAKAFGERLRSAVPVVVELASGAARLAGTLADVTSRAAAMMGGFDNLAMIVGGLFASKMIFSVVAFGASIVKAGLALGTLATTLPGLIGGIKALSLAFMTTPLGWVIGAVAAIAAGAIYLWKNWETIGPKFAALWEGIKAAASAAWEGLKALFDWSPLSVLRSAWSGTTSFFNDIWATIGETFQGGLGSVAQLLVNWSPLGLLWRGISGALSTLGIELPETLSGLGGMLIDGLIGGITGKLGELRESITGLGGSITGWFKGVLGINSPSKVFAGFGGNLLEGLVGGIDEKWGVLKDKIGNTAGAVVGWFKDKLGINSPSRVFADLGGHTMDGYEKGIARSEAGPLKEISRFGQQVRNAGAGLALGAATLAMPAAADSGSMQRPDLPAIGGVSFDSNPVQFDSRPPLASQGGGGDVHITIGDINVHAAPGMDEQALARLVAQEVQRALSNAERDAATRRRSAFHDLD